MTATPAAGYISNSSRTKGDGKAWDEQTLQVIKEIIGGAPEQPATALASHVLTVANGGCVVIADTQAAAASDTLTNIVFANASDLRDGMLVGVRLATASHVISFNSGGGSKGLSMRNGNYTLRTTNEIVWFKYKGGSSDIWEQVFIDLTSIISQLLGSGTLTSVAVTSNAITPVVPFNSITAASDLLACNGANTTSFPNGNGLLLVTAASASTRPLMKHNVGIGGVGKFLHRDAADITLSVGQWILYYQNAGNWTEIGRYGFISVPIPSTTTPGQIMVGNGAGGYATFTPPASSNGFLLGLDTSANGSNGLRAFRNPLTLPGGRLSSGNVGVYSSLTTITYSPYLHDMIPLYDATSQCVVMRKFTTLTLNVSALSGAYWISVYDNSGTLTLRATPYTSASVNGLQMQNGIWVPTSNPASPGAPYLPGDTYLGSLVMPTSSWYGCDGVSLRNMYNRLPSRAVMNVNMTAASYTYVTNTYRNFGGSLPGLNFVAMMNVNPAGVDDRITAEATSIWKVATASTQPNIKIGFGSSTTPTQSSISDTAPVAGGTVLNSNYISHVECSGVPSYNVAGYSQINALECGDGSHTFTFFPQDTTTGTQMGLAVQCEG